MERVTKNVPIPQTEERHFVNNLEKGEFLDIAADVAADFTCANLPEDASDEALYFMGGMLAAFSSALANAVFDIPESAKGETTESEESK